MHHDVGAESERALQCRSREGVVDDEQGADLTGGARERGDVGDPQQRVARRLHPDQLRGRLRQRLLDGARVAEVGDAHRHAPGDEDLRDQAIRSAVGVVSEEDLIARAQHPAQQRVFRREARRERQAEVGALDRGELPLQRRAGGVAGAPVVVAVAQVADAVLHERRREVDRGDHGAAGGIRLLTGVHGEAVEVAGEGRAHGVSSGSVSSDDGRWAASHESSKSLLR